MERGRALKCVLRVRGPAPSTTNHHRPGRGSCGWKAGRKRQRVVAGAGGVGPGAHSRTAASPSGSSCPLPLLWRKATRVVPPPSSLAVGRGVGGREAGPETCRCPRPVSSPTCCCCCWRKGTVVPDPLRPGRRHPSVSPRDLHSRSPNSLSGSPARTRSRERVGGDPPRNPASWLTRNPLTSRFTLASTGHGVRRLAVRRLVAFVLRGGRTGPPGPALRRNCRSSPT